MVPAKGKYKPIETVLKKNLMADLLEKDFKTATLAQWRSQLI